MDIECSIECKSHCKGGTHLERALCVALRVLCPALWISSFSLFQ